VAEFSGHGIGWSASACVEELTMALSPGIRFGPYEVAAEIGAGGMGVVYQATDTKLNRLAPRSE
jgi:hypothetical protein